MAGKILKVASNDLYGNVDDRMVSVFACFEHIKYMNNFVVFSINNEMNKLYYGSIHFKKNSIVVFSVKENVKKYINQFLNEYMDNNMSEFKLLDIGKMEKIELVSFNSMEYANLSLLDYKSIPRVEVKEEVVMKKKKPIFLYFLLFILIFMALGLTILYLKPELFTIKYKAISCTNNLFDSKLQLYYGIEEDIKFDKNDKVMSISVIRTYTFLDSSSYYEFKNNENHIQYFIDGERYKYMDNELKFKLFYEESSVIDDYDEMLTYLKKEGFSCEKYEYER